MSRTEQQTGKNRRKRKIVQITFFIILLITCFALLYYFNLLPFGVSSDILAYERINILAVGTDSVQNNGRADTILVLSVSPKTRDTVLLSIPRDMRVMIPNSGMDKINHSFAYGGVTLLKETVEDFTGLPIHFYGVMDFEGFQYIIDAIGGVELEVEKDMYYVDQAGSLKINLHRGYQTLDGEKALEYVRFRFDPMGDLGRIQRQQRLINAVIDKIMNFENMMKIPGILNRLPEYIETNMASNEVVSLAKLLTGINREKIWVETISGEPQYINGISYLVTDSLEVKTRIEHLLMNHNRGLNVEVLNGNQAPGIAQKVAEDLKEMGLNVVRIGNADHFNYHKTMIIVYSKGIKIEKDLNKILDEYDIIHKEDPQSDLDLTIIIGKNMLY